MDENLIAVRSSVLALIDRVNALEDEQCEMRESVRQIADLAQQRLIRAVELLHELREDLRKNLS